MEGKSFPEGKMTENAAGKMLAKKGNTSLGRIEII
jgi:hypothetical protein